MNRIILPFFVLIVAACTSQKEKLHGKFLGQQPPGNTPELFAPGIVNDGISTRDIAFTPDGKEVYFSKNIGNSNYATIFFCRETENGWTEPEVVSFAKNPEYIYIEPFISPGGEKLFFVSNQGNEFTPQNRYITDIWVAERKGDSWCEPQKLDSVINSGKSEFFPTMAENGNLYFTREDPISREGFIYKSEFKDGKYQAPEKLPAHVNAGAARFNATIAKDESFIIVPVYGMEDSFGATDYYISFFSEDNGWSNLQNLGSPINTADGNEYSAGFSPDGEYFFFMSARTETGSQPDFTYENFVQLHNSPENGNSSIYWMKSDFIEKLREKAIFTENYNLHQ